MAFTQEVSAVPTSIGGIEVRLFTGATGAGSVEYTVKIVRSDGSVVVRSGNLVPHITANQLTQLQSFMATLRGRAEDEFLP